MSLIQESNCSSCDMAQNIVLLPNVVLSRERNPLHSPPRLLHPTLTGRGSSSRHGLCLRPWYRNETPIEKLDLVTRRPIAALSRALRPKLQGANFQWQRQSHHRGSKIEQRVLSSTAPHPRTRRHLDAALIDDVEHTD